MTGLCASYDLARYRTPLRRITVDKLEKEKMQDKLQVIKMAEQKGGKQRREAIEKLMIYARNLGCKVTAGGGSAGGINFRYGSICYAIMDITTDGEVKIYGQCHPNKNDNDLNAKINRWLESREDIKLKSHPVNCHGLLSQKVEEVPLSALIEFLEKALEYIKEIYYKPTVR